jgi:hypothetical protein
MEKPFIPLGDFKALFGIDNREDKLAQFCLVTGTYKNYPIPIQGHSLIQIMGDT